MFSKSVSATRSNLMANLIDQSNGKFFACTFIKKDGTIRQMTARLGVTKYLKGGKSNVDSSKYITVFEPSSGKYKNINRDSILALSIAGVEVAAK